MPLLQWVCQGRPEKGNNINSKVHGLEKGKYSFAWKGWEWGKGRQVPGIQDYGKLHTHFTLQHKITKP